MNSKEALEKEIDYLEVKKQVAYRNEYYSVYQELEERINNLKQVLQDLDRLEKLEKENASLHTKVENVSSETEKLFKEFLDKENQRVKKELKQTKLNFKNSQIHSKNCYKKLKAKYQKLEKEHEKLKEKYKHRAETSNDLCEAVKHYEKAFEILKEVCSLNCDKTLETERQFLRLSKEEYELLKEVLGYGR